jgi:A/G-specific adenine glycosylase
VVARLFAVETPLPAAKPELRALAADLTPEERPGDYAQAMMDLGATLCLPRRPRCGRCPLAGQCAARAAGKAEDLPRRSPKPARPTRRAVAFWAIDPHGAVLLRRRPAKGLLGGMMELPSTEWREAAWDQAEVLAQAPLAARWAELPGVVRHTFTHFHLEARVWAARAGPEAVPAEGRWVALDDLGGEALPSVMRKIVRHALEGAAAREEIRPVGLRTEAGRSVAEGSARGPGT